jgi:hypothetical protein
MVLAMNYRQVFADVTAGIMSGHNMRTAKFSDLDTVAMFKLTASEIGDVKCVKRSAEERVVDSESFDAQKLIPKLSVNVLDVGKIKELLAIAMRKTDVVSKLAGAVDLSAEDGAEIPTRSTNQDDADRPIEVKVEVPEFPDRNENEPIGGDLIPPAGGRAPGTRFGAGGSGNRSKAKPTAGRPVGSARKDKCNLEQFNKFQRLLFKPVIKGSATVAPSADYTTAASMKKYVESAITTSTNNDDTQKKKLQARSSSCSVRTTQVPRTTRSMAESVSG